MEHIEQLLMLIKYLFLGLFQGFTEPIPISSSGHVVLLRELFHINVPGLSFEIFIHFGSLIAIIIVYRKDLYRLLKNSLLYLIKVEEEKREDFQFVTLLVIATIPAGLIGLLFEEKVSQLLTYTFLIGLALFITGIFLWIIRNKRGDKGDTDLSVKHAILIGLAQALAIFPGISRSGATIIAAMLLGMRREIALRFSFLLYIPISFGATIISIKDFFIDPHLQSLFIPYLIAFCSAIIATYFSLQWFINIMLKGNLKYFAYYCFIAGSFVFFYFL